MELKVMREYLSDNKLECELQNYLGTGVHVVVLVVQD
jgi:hypothetical protein